jgi:hypothetical protein
MSWLWHRPATGSSCIRRCAVEEGRVTKKMAEQSVLTTSAWLPHIVERCRGWMIAPTAEAGAVSALHAGKDGSLVISAGVLRRYDGCVKRGARA